MILSNHSVNKHGFVQKEIKLALDVLQNYPEGEIFIIPVRLEECKPAYQQLKKLHWVDMFPSWENGLDMIFRVVKTERVLETSITDIAKVIEDRMITVSGGSFIMGDFDEGQIEVSVSSFLIDKYPMTQQLYQQISGSIPCYFKGNYKPVETVSWFDAVKFCNSFSNKLGLDPAYIIENQNVKLTDDATGFRLLTEAEWEYACRAGAVEDCNSNLDEIAWYGESWNNGSPHEVGGKKPNKWGLFDMLGNVLEWCWDWYDKYPAGLVNNPKGPSMGYSKVVRGGCWIDVPLRCRFSCRSSVDPDYRSDCLGFRLARSLP